MLGSEGSRRTGLALVAAAGLALSGGAAFAQEDPATPPASTPEAERSESSTGSDLSAAEKSALAAEIQTLTETIASVQADRDAVADRIDVAEVDRLLAKATEVRDGVQAALDGDDAATAPRDLRVGIATAATARALVVAEASAYGLPSQQAATSRALVEAYYAVDEVNERQVAAPNDDAAFFVETAKTLYARAYEAYNAGMYAQAAATARVAADIGWIAAMAGDDANGFSANERIVIPPATGMPGFEVEIPDWRGDGVFGRDRDVFEVLPPEAGRFEIVPGRPATEWPPIAMSPGFDAAPDTPLEVPAPTFD